MKLLLAGRLDPSRLELFAREARAGGRMRHPNVVHTVAHGQEAGLAWIAQELVEGGHTLREWLDEFRRSEELPEDYYRRVAALVIQLAGALDSAHREGVSIATSSLRTCSSLRTGSRS